MRIKSVFLLFKTYKNINMHVEIERDFFIFWKCFWEIRTDNPSLAVKILNGTPRPNVPSQKGLVKKIASDNHSRIFTTLLSQTVFIILICVYCIYPHPSHKARLFVRRMDEACQYTHIWVTLRQPSFGQPACSRTAH